MFLCPKHFLTADHRSLYDTNRHVPFIVSGPAIPHDHMAKGLDSNADSAPTTLDLGGLPPLPATDWFR